MPKTILIVDDVPFVRKTLADILTEAHYKVIGQAENGAQALKMFQDLIPDLVTMDVVMPEMSGIEATRKIMLMKNDAKIVIITAMGQENLVMDAINAGAKDYIVKPFSSKDVLNTIERVLDSA